ncbi:MAG TPA: hypothetical protein VFB58_14435 [Chloroflexota bacterium]|nr:hypothetical protein [Chloroflexota bacterium]
MSRTRLVVAMTTAGVLALGVVSLGRPAAAAVPLEAATATATATVGTVTATATSTATAVVATGTATATPPPPPPPPSVATATATAAAPTATATAAPLGASAVLVARANVRHVGASALVRWTMAYQLGVKGFRIYAHRRDLTPRLIHPHHARSYSARVPWTNGGHYSLHILFKNGHTQTKAIR